MYSSTQATLSFTCCMSLKKLQIRKRGDDSALFSLSEEKKVIHGLDELVHFYKNNVHSGLQHRLTEHVPGEECPLMFKLHGSENLLHRATANGNYEVLAHELEFDRRTSQVISFANRVFFAAAPMITG